jgi:hypothetical protein
MLSICRRKAKPVTDMPGIRKKRGAGQRVRMRDVSRSLPLALMRAREATMRYFRPHLRSLAVTEQQWRVLRVLHSAGSLEAKTLARRAAARSGAVARGPAVSG